MHKQPHCVYGTFWYHYNQSRYNLLFRWNFELFHLQPIFSPLLCNLLHSESKWKSPVSTAVRQRRAFFFHTCNLCKGYMICSHTVPLTNSVELSNLLIKAVSYTTLGIYSGLPLRMNTGSMNYCWSLWYSWYYTGLVDLITSGQL